MSVISVIEFARLACLKKLTDTQQWALAQHGLFLFYFAVCIFWEVAGQTLLQPDYFAYPISEMWVLAAVAVWGARLPPQELRDSSPLQISLLVLLSLGSALWLMAGSDLQRHETWLFNPLYIALFYLVLFFIVAAEASWFRSVIGLAILFPLANVLAGGGDVGAYSPQSCPYGREGNEVLVGISRFATAYAEGKPDRVFLWLDERETLARTECPRVIKTRAMGFVGDSLIGLWHRTVDSAFPIKPLEQLDDDALRYALHNGVVAIVSNDPNNVTSMRRRYAQLGITTRLISSRRFQGKTLDLMVYVIGQEIPGR